MRNLSGAERRYAKFYDLFSSGFRSDAAIYLDIAAKQTGPVLEIGCGTGRVAERLARAGCEVVGVDISRDMLEVARQRLRPYRDRVRILHHDFRDRPLMDRFRTILITLFTFNYLIEIEEQRRLLRHVRRSAESPGVVAIDFFCPLPMLQPEVEGEWRTVDRKVKGKELCVRDHREMLTPLLEKRTQRFRTGTGSEDEVVTHRRYISPFAAGRLLEEAGFERPRWIRNYDLGTEAPIEADDRPDGPFLILADF